MDRDELRNGLQEILKEILTDPSQAPESLSEGMSLREDLGMDSLQVVEALFEIEERFGAKIEDEEARQLATVKEVLDMIEVKLAAGTE